MEGGRFASGSPVTVTAATKDDGRSVSVEGRIAPGARSVVVTLVPPTADAPLRVTLRMLLIPSPTSVFARSRAGAREASLLSSTSPSCRLTR